MSPPPLPLPDDPLDLAEFSRRLSRGRRQTLALGLIGAVLALAWRWHEGAAQALATTAELTFSPTYLVRGEFPDQSHFTPADLLAPDLIRAAWQSLGREPTETQLTATREALAVRAVIPAAIAQARDRLLATGQVIDPYFPTEFEVAFTRPRNQWPPIPLRSAFMAAWLRECSRAYGHLNPPPSGGFASPFARIAEGDAIDWDKIIGRSVRDLESYARKRSDQSRLALAPHGLPATSSAHAATWSELADRLGALVRDDLTPAEDRIAAAGYSRRPEVTLEKLQFEVRNLDAEIAEAKAKTAVIERLLREISPRLEEAGRHPTGGGPPPLSPVSVLVDDEVKIAWQQIQQEARRAQFEADRDAVRNFAAADRQVRGATTKACEDALAGLNRQFDGLFADFQSLYARDPGTEPSNSVSFDSPQTTDPFRFSVAVSGALGLAAGAMLGAFLSSQAIYLPRGNPGGA